MRLLFFTFAGQKKPLTLIIPQKCGPVKQNSLDDLVCILGLSQLEVLGSSGKLAYAAYAGREITGKCRMRARGGPGPKSNISSIKKFI